MTVWAQILDAVQTAVQNWRYRREERKDQDRDLMVTISTRWE